MGTIIIEGFPEQEEKKESWLADDSPDAIRADEMFARQLDNELADELHALQAGLVAKSGEDALAAIGELSPTMAVLKQRYLAQALGERQKGLIAPLIDQRIEQMGRAVGGIARRATQEVDDETVQRRLDGFRRDAALVSDDWQQLRTLGRATAAELRYLGERRDWNRTETETRVVAAVGNLYAGAVEAAIDRDPDKAAALYDHARSVIAPERQVDLERRFAMAREDRLVREIDRVLGANLPDPEAPPTAEALSARAAELTPDNASEELRGRIAATVAAAQRRLDRRREKQHATAGLAALEWLGSNPDASQLLLPSQVRRWLAADQLEALDAFAERGRLATNDEVFNHLEKLMVYEPSAFAALELARHRLSLDEADYKRFRNAQLAIESSSPDAAVVRTRHARVETDRALLANGIDPKGDDARIVRTNVRDRLDAFPELEGRAANGSDIDRVVAEEMARLPRGAAIHPEPYPGSPEYREAQAAIPVQRNPTSATSEVMALPALKALSEAAKQGLDYFKRTLVSRVVPVVASVAGSAAALAVPLISIPANISRRDDVIDLGDGLRLRQATSFNDPEVVLEQKVDEGAGTRWDRVRVPILVYRDGDRWHVALDTNRFGTLSDGELERALGILSPMARPPKRGVGDNSRKAGVDLPDNQAPSPDPRSELAMAVFTAIAMEYLSRPLFERGQYNEHDARPTAVGVRLNPELGEPAAGYGYNPVHPAHRAGFYGELTVANHIAAAGDKVVRFGNRAGVNGPDIVSVGRNGEVTIWDSKWRTADVPLGPSARPHQSENALQAALKEARESIVVARNAGRLSPEVAERALANLEGNYTIVTVPTGNARGGYVEQVKNQLRVLKDRN